MASSSANPYKVARGTIWQHAEVLDLLQIWGDQRIQEQLNSCRRNISIFEEVSAEMSKRGHSRSAEECRRKTKALKMDYRQVVLHNSKSGNDLITCPYFERLHDILHADACVLPKRVATSQIQPFVAPEVVSVEGPAPSNTVDPSQELYSDLQIIDVSLYLSRAGIVPPYSAASPPGTSADPLQVGEEDGDLEATMIQERSQGTSTPTGHVRTAAGMTTPVGSSSLLRPHHAITARMQRHMDDALAAARHNTQQNVSPSTSAHRCLAGQTEEIHAEATRPVPAADGPRGATTHHGPDDPARLSPPSRLQRIRGRDKRPRAQRQDQLFREFLLQNERQHDALMAHLQTVEHRQSRLHQELRADRQERLSLARQFLQCFQDNTAACNMLVQEHARLSAPDTQVSFQGPEPSTRQWPHNDTRARRAKKPYMPE